MGSVLLLLLVSCGSSAPTPPTPTNCTVVRMVSVQTGFRVGSSTSPNATIVLGGCIEFINEDSSSAHNAASAVGTATNRQFNTAFLPAGQRQKVVFNLAGQIEYICQVGNHAATMRGVIRVQ